MEAVDPALIKGQTVFAQTVPQTDMFFNGTLTTATLVETCLQAYKAKLIELLVDAQLQLNAQFILKNGCRDLGLHIIFTGVQLFPQINTNKVREMFTNLM